MTLHVLTGASRGLGAAMLRQLLREGHHVVAAARGAAPELGPGSTGRLDWTRIDLGDPAAARSWVVDALAELSFADEAALILNAGILEPVVPVAALQAEALEANMRINLVSPMLVTAGFLEATADRGVKRRVLAISSGAARRGTAHWSAYCASKAGLDNFVRALNSEQAGEADASVRAVSLAPGVVDTAMQESVRGSLIPDRARFQALHDEGRLTTPEDAAAAILACLRRDDFGSVEIDDIRNH
ncbi:SDR family NAD(P)-dependent oxidoreductase [Lichenicola sp.]|uniref:SDR family NAD(P)-dependent oxidoreductase n=1 Tax=Lichenicola sp. TaxID=2804529 RepID=UPI003B003589